MFHAGLVLEGGGMRGVYTAGVLDEWMARGVSFQTIYGVSAGAIQACSMLSQQPRRGYECIVNYMDDWRYCSIRSLLLTGNLFGVKMCYDTIPNKLHPFDYETYAQSPSTLYAVMTDTQTGEAVYYPISDMHRDTVAIRASASLPLVSRMVKVDGRRYLDGGVADSIPLKRALDDHPRAVVVLTQDPAYHKQPSTAGKLAALRYPRHKALHAKLDNRHIRYNEQLDFVRQMEAEGRAFVIQPQSPVCFDRVEKDRTKLESLYQQGHHDAERLYAPMLAFLQGEPGSGMST